ncbi:MAG TPA: DUF4388 domain-containing protein [Pyrinomonadaceae bacterium]|nr:DUF4388 domain-containing protein [Pyrinomonadaceae bacterium]
MEAENIERAQFVVMTGHTDEQPLAEIIGRLRVQRKTGRLRVEYDGGPASFFFEDGQLIDAEMGSMRGVEAAYAALSLGGAPFNFNPLVRPPERSIARHEQQFIRDLVEGRAREGRAEIRVAGADASQAIERAQAGAVEQQQQQLAPVPAEMLAPIEERLVAVEGAIVSASRRFSRERLAYAVVIGFLTGLAVIMTLNSLLGPFFSDSAQPAAAVAPAPPARPATAAAPETSAPEQQQSAGGAPVPATAAVIGTRREGGVPSARREHVVQVLVEVRDGRVVDARVWNPRPGAGAYEQVALGMARERRYPDGFTGGERVKIRVVLPDKSETSGVETPPDHSGVRRFSGTSRGRRPVRVNP